MQLTCGGSTLGCGTSGQWIVLCSLFPPPPQHKHTFPSLIAAPCGIRHLSSVASSVAAQTTLLAHCSVWLTLPPGLPCLLRPCSQLQFLEVRCHAAEHGWGLEAFPLVLPPTLRTLRLVNQRDVEALPPDISRLSRLQELVLRWASVEGVIGAAAVPASEHPRHFCGVLWAAWGCCNGPNEY